MYQTLKDEFYTIIIDKNDSMPILDIYRGSFLSIEESSIKLFLKEYKLLRISYPKKLQFDP